jgi:hypothetical protein
MERRLLASAFRHWGWLLAEFARFPRHDARSIEQVIVYDGLENYLKPQRAGAASSSSALTAAPGS